MPHADILDGPFRSFLFLGIERRHARDTTLEIHWARFTVRRRTAHFGDPHNLHRVVPFSEEEPARLVLTIARALAPSDPGSQLPPGFAGNANLVSVVEIFQHKVSVPSEGHRRRLCHVWLTDKTSGRGRPVRRQTPRN